VRRAHHSWGSPNTKRKTIPQRILNISVSAAIYSAAPAFAQQYTYTPSQIRTAYGFNGVMFNGVAATGAGETIAIVDAYNTPTIQSDLSTFDTEFGISAPPAFTIENQTGGSKLPTGTNSGWAVETAVDVEWAHAIAPNANILLVEANNSNSSNLYTGVRTAAAAAGTSAVTMSWGGAEFSGETASDSTFTTPNGHQGVSFVASTGDSGSVEYPSTSPNVLAVGGTALYLNSSGGYGSETAWNDSYGSGGGGLSTQETEPSYQRVAQQTGSRSVPDVSYDADVNTGMYVFSDGNWYDAGGTSCGSPQWAALIAIADQGRAANGLATLSSSNLSSGLLPSLYDLYNTPYYTQGFNDVTVGTTSTGQAAGPGYDTATGLGTPKAGFLIPYLAGEVSIAQPAASLTWNNAGGKGDGRTWDVADYQNWNDGSAAVVYIDGSNVTFNDSNSHNYAVTLNVAVSPGSVTVNNSLGNYTISGTGSIADAGSFVKTGGNTLTLGAALSVTGATSITGGTLMLAPNVSGTSGPAVTSTINLTSLSITGNGVLDVNNNHFIITYGSSDPISTIAGYIESGYNGGAWNGPGIISTAAQTSTNGLLYGVGYADGKDGVVSGLASGQIEVTYTLLGDANLEGVVNGADLTILAANYNQSVTGWDQGDFNYDGMVNGIDLSDLAVNFNQGVSGGDVSAGDVAALDAFAAANGISLANVSDVAALDAIAPSNGVSSANVPEPASAAMMLMAGLGILRRRRRSAETRMKQPGRNS
ncbi:MAG: PEP-CTERM sorting domain-containing protein, partial [Tepidisphaeraceae bacterium]